MALTNYEKQKRWREKNRALYNFQQRQRRKNLSGSVSCATTAAVKELQDPHCIPNEGAAKAGYNPSPAQTSKKATIEGLRGLMDRVSSEPDVPVARPQVFKNDYGAIISESAYNRLQEKKRLAREGGYVLDEYSQ